jgi:hypothetical protein
MENTLKQITLGQVKQIAAEVSKHFELTSNATYYNIIDKKTRKCSIQGGDKNLTYGDFYDLIQYNYLCLVGENGLYFDWQSNGVHISLERKKYVYKIQSKVVQLICGFEINTGA